MAVTLLPRFCVLENGGRYLSVTENPPADNLPSGFLRFNEEQIWNPRVKFAVERAQTGDGQLVHIRSCFNNRYWEAIPRVGHMRVLSASAQKPEEDRSKTSCTLFEIFPTRLPRNTITLRFIQNSISASRIDDRNPVHLRAGLTVESSTSIGLFNVTDWETLVILPTQVSFRSEELNRNLLCSRILDRRFPYQRFESGVDIGDPVVAKDLFPTNNGNYRIRDVHFDKFWRRSPNWIWADAEDDNNSNDVLFSIQKISNTIFALRNLGNNRFCGGLTTEGKTDCLNAHYPTISRQARLMIEERVLDREIFDVRYRLSDSRIYQEEIQEVSHAFANNNSPDRDSTVELRYSISDSRTTHWTNSISITIGVTVRFNVTIIPFIAGGNLELSTEVGNTYEWGVSETTVRTREAIYTVVVPPLTTMKVTLMSTRAASDVPFSYTQRDLLTTGERVTTFKDDGLYSGINSFNFYFESSRVPRDAQGRVYFDDPPST